MNRFKESFIDGFELTCSLNEERFIIDGARDD